MTPPPTFDVPRDLHYDGERHLWIRCGEDPSRLRMGIDTLGLESLGELAFVSLQAVGFPVTAGESVGTLEAAKMTDHIVAPISGVLLARNEAVLADPLLVNRDPYGEGWLLEIEPTRWDEESAALISGEAIDDWAAAEIEHLKSEPPTTR